MKIGSFGKDKVSFDFLPLYLHILVFNFLFFFLPSILSSLISALSTLSSFFPLFRPWLSSQPKLPDQFNNCGGGYTEHVAVPGDELVIPTPLLLLQPTRKSKTFARSQRIQPRWWVRLPSDAHMKILFFLSLLRLRRFSIFFLFLTPSIRFLLPSPLLFLFSPSLSLLGISSSPLHPPPVPNRPDFFNL